ncbi:MAG: DUF5591 domain-containing protein [Candidatus Aenigmarchaeota archaeon]|nr:DUF5591 domain-containing protein [Candidatus Aenigmarchaeota archaeon]MDW8149057.1 DUF5591 domain-containing protein [Candidatus Aenigmarchaeota archaeon]
MNPDLKGSDELFFHPAVVNYYRMVIEKWVSNKKTALLLGCSMHKPYSTSFMHKKVIGLLKKHGLENEVQQYIIGEPMVVVPRELENLYPASNYDFDPKNLCELGKRVFIERLRAFFNKAVNMHERFVVFAPNHHKQIILSASANLFEPVLVSYNIYKLPKLLSVLKGETC